MLRFLVVRLLRAVLTLFGISVLTFVMFFGLPRDPASALCGKGCGPERVAAVRHELGLDRPKVVQYGEYMRGLFVGRTLGDVDGGRRCHAPCLGYSYANNEFVTEGLARVLPVTLSIVLPAATIWLLFGVALGMMSALRRGTAFDKISVGVSLTGASMQIYFLGLILLLLLVYNLKVLPNPGYTPLLSDPGRWVAGLVLPWLTLAFINSALYARLARAQMLETLSEDFVRTANAKGLSRSRVYLRHALRAAITPIVTIAGLDLGSFLGGTVITESTFGIQGLGRYAIDAVGDGNFPVIMATVLVAAVFVILGNMLVDLVYPLIDPRVKLT